MSSVPTEDRLGELLLRWDELRRQGREMSAEELCADCPELAAELRRRIAVVRGLEPVLDVESTRFVATPGDGGPDSSGPDRRLPDALHAAAVYRPRRHHAQGGLGEVLAAHQEELDRTVALKRIRPDRLHDAARRRFLREAAITARLQHPGIVPIYGLGQDKDGPFYTMPFIEGRTLQEAIDAFHGDEASGRDPGRRGLKFRGLLQQFIAVCNTMAYAHDQGVIHRDLKPSNIMLGPYGETLVMDWGLAKRLGTDDAGFEVDGDASSPSPSPDALTAAGAVLGTLYYMSPEQARGEPTSPASDVFSLGLILYAILTGESPYADAALQGGDLQSAVREAAVVPPRRRNPGLPGALEAICLRALAARPEGRYSSPRALAEDLSNWLADEPVGAYRDPFTERARRWVKRNRTAVTGAAGALLAGIVGLGVVTGILANSNHRERALRAEAVAARDHAERAKQGALTEKARAERAQNQAIAEAERARQEARKATMLSDFLVRLFQSSDPLGLEGQGFREPTESVKELTTIQILRRGAERISSLTQSSEDDLATTAVLMDTIGNSLRVLGDYEHAQPLLEAGWKARRAAGRRDDRGLADSVFHLGILAHESLDVATAEGRYREAIALYDRAAGAGSLAALRVKFRLAWLLAMERRVDEAEKLFREVLERRQAQLGAGHLDVQNVRLALMLVMLERGDRMALLAQAHEVFGKNSLAAGTVIAYSRAMAYRLARNYPAAKRQYEDVLVTARKLLPPRHLLLALLLGDMAGMYREAGDLDRVDKLMREALEIGRRTIPLHPLMIDGLTMYADEMAKHGRIEEAERHYLEAVELGRRRSRIHPSDDRWKRALERMVRMEEERGRNAKAGEYRKLFDRDGRTGTGIRQPGR